VTKATLPSRDHDGIEVGAIAAIVIIIKRWNRGATAGVGQVSVMKKQN
jgi:hypothetical protein